MKAARVIAIAVFGYVGIVAAFEALMGFFQPSGGNTLVITTTDENGNAGSRVLARLESGGQLYVAANHWPRAWYNRALANPDVEIDVDGQTSAYRAVPVSGEEYDRIDGENSRGFGFLIVSGFPPRRILRLDPR